MRRCHPGAQADVGRRPRGDGRALPARARCSTSAPSAARSTGWSRSSYPHPDLADILDETYGVIVYQDQVLQDRAEVRRLHARRRPTSCARRWARRSPTSCRRSSERFVKGADEKGYTEADAEKVFDLIEPFAGYAFNKAHSYSYGTMRYQTAWLKANYPHEYMTAVLMGAESHPAGMLERVAQSTTSACRIGIAVLPPDVNKSGVNFRSRTRRTAASPSASASRRSRTSARAPPSR